MKPIYQPINCHFYDELELLAIRQKPCIIIFTNEDNKEESLTSRIKDFKIIDRAEYMLLEDGKFIRLDYLISVDGKKLEGFACGI